MPKEKALFEDFDKTIVDFVAKAEVELARKTDNRIIETYLKFGIEPPKFEPFDEQD